MMSVNTWSAARISKGSLGCFILRLVIIVFGDVQEHSFRDAEEVKNNMSTTKTSLFFPVLVKISTPSLQRIRSTS